MCQLPSLPPLRRSAPAPYLCFLFKIFHVPPIAEVIKIYFPPS